MSGLNVYVDICIIRMMRFASTTIVSIECDAARVLRDDRTWTMCFIWLMSPVLSLPEIHPQIRPNLTVLVQLGRNRRSRYKM